MLNVQAIFNSIDGEVSGFEGSGELSTFIRLRGCNLRCQDCDTKYAQNSEEAQLVSVEEILSFPNLLKKVTITGGEPLLQTDTIGLIKALLKRGCRITVETNGSVIVPVITGLPYLVHSVRFVVDYKLPSSGMEEKMNPEVFAHLRPIDVVKFVIADYNDFYIARGLAVSNKEVWKAKMVFSPMIGNQSDYTNWPATLAECMIDDAAVLGDVQFSLQIHKVLWPNATKER